MDSDEELFGQMRAGELAAFDRLYARHGRRLFGFIRVQLGDAAEAEDVLHEAFLAVLDRPPAVLRFKPWLFSVARNLCLNRVRARQRAGRALERVAREPAAAVDDAAPGADAPSLVAAIARLPSALAEVYQLRASGLSYDEVASVLDVPLGTVKLRMHEMVRRLREEMKP